MKWAAAIAPRVSPKDSQRLRWERAWEWQPVVGAVPVLPAEVTASQRWSCLIKGAWRFDEPIHVTKRKSFGFT